MTREIQFIVIHCAASQNGKRLGDGQRKTAVKVIDVWHSQRGFKRSPAARDTYNPDLFAIGYHWVIDCDGSLGTGRHINEVGAHVAGRNSNSLGVCLVGTDAFTARQWEALHSLIKSLKQKYPSACVVGHRDLSPDLNGDGKITPNEFTKLCPGFIVDEWLIRDMQPLQSHLIGG